MSTPRLTIAAALAALLATACGSGPHTGAARASRRASAHQQISGSQATVTSATAPYSPVSPRDTPHAPGVPSPAVRRAPAATTASIPDHVAAASTAVDVATAWATAANSSSYLDPDPGSWTTRTRRFVTGTEASAEQHQRSGGGGSTWAQIRAGSCVTSVRELAVGIPSDAPTGPDLHIVYLTAVTALTCATGQVQLGHFTAQLTVTRANGRWLVADVRH